MTGKKKKKDKKTIQKSNMRKSPAKTPIACRRSTRLPKEKSKIRHAPNKKSTKHKPFGDARISGIPPGLKGQEMFSSSTGTYVLNCGGTNKGKTPTFSKKFP